MKAEIEETVDEVKRLKACVNDLTSVLALPAIWSGGEPRQIISTLLDVLLGMLRLDFAYAELKDPTSGAPIEMVRLAQSGNPPDHPRDIGQALDPWLGGDPHPSPLLVQNPTGDGDVSIAPLRLGLQDETGWLVAGTRRADFPTETERLLLSVAANQAAIGLHEARLLSEQKRVAAELDHKVTQRTRELKAANEELKKEIAERKIADERLRRSESLLAEAQRISHTGSFGWNVASGELFWSEETFRVFEYDRATQPTIERVLERTHPEDSAIVQQTIDRACREGKDFDLEHRLLMPDGSIKYVHLVGCPVGEPSGKLEFVGAVMDITIRKLAFHEIQTLKDQLHKENIALRQEVDQASMFEEIVGASPALRAVLSNVTKVAPTDSTVLITGETGTGKELIARAIHKRSRRSSRAFVSVNCAAIPQSLIASELFGHEKGAFTGALQRRQGRFELAEGGTVFLDEIGDLLADTQNTLLRVLQEREFERVGGTQSIRADVRVIAATNRDLKASMIAGAFRSDLFYRLNVFPIEIPPLRERREDIPMLVEYFIDRYASKAGKKISSINKQSLKVLQSYPWPGNIRELQNVIERSVIVCETESVVIDENWLSRDLVKTPSPSRPLSEELVAREKETIEATLAETRGRVSGPAGAAVKLGIPRSTLDSKIRSLKINKHRFKNF